MAKKNYLTTRARLGGEVIKDQGVNRKYCDLSGQSSESGQDEHKRYGSATRGGVEKQGLQEKPLSMKQSWDNLTCRSRVQQSVLRRALKSVCRSG